MPVRLTLIALASLLGVPLPAAAQEAPDFFGAALCQPPYSTDSATALYEAAEKVAKADTSMLGAAIYTLPTPIERDGFVARAVVFAGMSIGVLLGGVIADRTDRHGLVTGTVIGAAAVTIVLAAFGAVPLLAVAVSIALGGLLYGIAMPSRDLLVRAATPPGFIGIAFGFTSTGLGIGGAIGPVVCGWAMDAGRPDWMFMLIAAVTALAVFAVFTGRTADHGRDGR